MGADGGRGSPCLRLQEWPGKLFSGVFQWYVRSEIWLVIYLSDHDHPIMCDLESESAYGEQQQHICRKVFPDIVRLYLEVTVARAIRGAEVNGVALPTYWYQMPRVLAIIRPGRVGRPASRDLFSTFPPSFNMASARNIWKLNENKPIQLYTLYTIYRTTPVSTA